MTASPDHTTRCFLGKKEAASKQTLTSTMRAYQRHAAMNPRIVPPTPKGLESALAPFPRSTWVHPHVPNDSFDRVCKNIWRRAKEAAEELGRGQSSHERQHKSEREVSESKPSQRTKEQQKETDDLGLSTQCKEDKQQYRTDFTLPCPYLSGRRHPHVAKPARALNPVMEAEMKRNEGEAMGKRNLRDAEDKQSSVDNSYKKNWVVQSSIRGDKQSSPAPQPQPLASNPVCSAPEAHNLYLQEKEDPALSSKLPRETCEIENEQNMRCGSDSNSSDDDEPLSTMKAGILPCPTEPPASGKMHGQWDIPLSFHPHDISTVTLASAVTAHAQAPVQGKAEAPQANSKTNSPPTAPTQQDAYDLLADFPVLKPLQKPLALGVMHDGNPKTKDAEGKRGLTHSPNHRQESGASHQWRMENVPHEASSICTGDQKSVLDIQTFGSTRKLNSPTISCDKLNANNQPPPGVAGTDGVAVNARSWANAAKAGMKRAAAPQEKARHCTFQQIVTINRAKARNPDTPNNKVNRFHQAPVSSSVTSTYHGPRSRNPNQFVGRGHRSSNQGFQLIHKPALESHFGAWAHQAHCPPKFRCHRFPLQQAKGHSHKWSQA